VPASSDFFGAFAFDDGLFPNTADEGVTASPEAAQQADSEANPPMDDSPVHAAPAFEDDDDGMFFGTPSDGMGGSNAGENYDLMGVGAVVSSTLPPTASMSLKQDNSGGPVGGLFENGWFNRPISFMKQPAFFSGNSPDFFTDKELSGGDKDNGRQAQTEEGKTEESLFGSERRKPSSYESDSVSAWMAGRVPHPTLGAMEQQTLFGSVPDPKSRIQIRILKQNPEFRIQILL